MDSTGRRTTCREPARGWVIFGIVSLLALVGGVLMCAGVFVGDFVRVMWLEDQLGSDSDAMSGSMETPPLAVGFMVTLIAIAAAAAAGVAVSAVKLARRGGTEPAGSAIALGEVHDAEFARRTGQQWQTTAQMEVFHGGDRLDREEVHDRTLR